MGPVRAELAAITTASDHLELLHHTLSSMQIAHTIHLHTDSQDAMDLLAVNNPRPTEVSMLPMLQEIRDKGIRPVHVFATKASLDAALATLHKIPGDANPADCLTKSTLPGPLVNITPPTATGESEGTKSILACPQIKDNSPKS